MTKQSAEFQLEPMEKHAVNEPFHAALECHEGRTFGELEDHRSAWDRLAEGLDSPIYMSFEWCRVWWDHYGDGRELKLFLFYHESRLVGVIPLYLDTLRIYPFNTRIVRLVGSPNPPRVFNPPVDPDFADPIFDTMLEKVFRSWKADLLSFGLYSRSYLPGDALLQRCNARKDVVGKASKNFQGTQAVLELPRSMDDYMSGLSKNRRRNIRREAKNLKTKGYQIEDLSNGKETERNFDDFLDMHAFQWKDQGRLGHFRSWPGAEEFHRDLVAAIAPTRRLSLLKMWYDGSPASYLYSYYFGKSTFAELSARSVDPHLQWCSIGTHILLEQFRLSIEKGGSTIHLGPAHYDYKLGLSAEEQRIFNVRIVSPRRKSRALYLCLLLVRWLLNTVYHKVWYRRVQPRLPLRFRRPIWWPWIRVNI